MSTLASLHGRRGGTTSKNPHKISEKDGFALVVGATMMWVHFRNSTNPELWETIGREVKDAEGRDRGAVAEERDHSALPRNGAQHDRPGRSGASSFATTRHIWRVAPIARIMLHSFERTAERSA